MRHRFEFLGAKPVGLDNFVAFVRDHVRPDDLPSIARAAPKLAGLAQVETLFLRALQRRTLGAELLNGASAASIVLAQGDHFRLSAEVWPGAAEEKSRSIPTHTGYGVASDQVEHVLTTGYSGPGYEEALYSYDRSAVQGLNDEEVLLTKIDQFQLATGTVVLHPRCAHVSLRTAPRSASIALSLRVFTPEMALDDRLFFDVDAQAIRGAPANARAAITSSLFELALLTAGTDALPEIRRIAEEHPVKQVRSRAGEAAATASNAVAGEDKKA